MSNLEVGNMECSIEVCSIGDFKDHSHSIKIPEVDKSDILKGRKQCPVCHKLHAMKRMECSCNYNFLFKCKIEYKNNKANNDVSNIKSVIRERIYGPSYRGEHRSQHNRTIAKINEVITILKHIELYSDSDGIIKIPSGDDGDEIERTIHHENFYKMVDDIHEDLGKSTSMTLRKNTFPDLEKMEYIYRFPRKKNGSTKRREIDSISLTERGLELIKNENTRKKYSLHDIALAKLVGESFAEEIINVIKEVKQLSLKESMYFISDVVPMKDSVKMINMYRSLKKGQRKSMEKFARGEIKKINDEINRQIEENKNNINYCRDIFGVAREKECEVDNSAKVYKRDWDNWKNLAMQHFYILSQMQGFKILNKNILVLSESIDVSTKDGPSRDPKQKEEYDRWHGCTYDKGEYDAHHLFDFDNIETDDDKKEIDSFKNMLRIPPKEHAKLPSRGNKHVVLLSSDGNGTIRLGNIDDITDTEELNNCLYNNSKFLEMKKYNSMLINKYGDRIREI